MIITGLGNGAKTVSYLKNVYNLSQERDVMGLPVFTGDGKTFLGGFKGFYSVILSENDSENDREKIKKFVLEAKKKFGKVLCSFSYKNRIYGGPMGHFLLDIGKISEPEGRFILYSSKVRNQVKKSLKSGFEVKIGSMLEDFYELYKKSVGRLGGNIKNKSWFDRLVSIFGDDVICFSIFLEGKLVGCNFCIKNGNYIQLLFNVSLEEFWSLNVNNRLYDEMIAWSIKNGIKYIDFGPSLLSDKSHNHFKEGFGATVYYISDKNFTGPVGEIKDFCKNCLRSVKNFLKDNLLK